MKKNNSLEFLVAFILLYESNFIHVLLFIQFKYKYIEKVCTLRTSADEGRPGKHVGFHKYAAKRALFFSLFSQYKAFHPLDSKNGK